MADVLISGVGSNNTTPASTTYTEGETSGGTSEHSTYGNIIKKAHGLSDGAVVSVAAGVMNTTDVTASAAELNTLDGITASTAELNYTDGVTSAIQTQLDSKAASSHTHAQSDITNLTTDLATKKTDSMSTNKLLGRGTAGTGAIEEITLGTNLSLSGTTLNATGGGSVTVEDESLIIGMRFFGF